MWLEEPSGERINNMRAQEALSTQAQAIVTACPFCLTMLSDGVAAQSATQGVARNAVQKQQIPVKDVAEILAQSCHVGQELKKRDAIEA